MNGNEKCKTLLKVSVESLSNMDHVEKRVAKLEVKVEELDCRIKENKKLIKGLVKRVCRNFGHE